MSSQTLELSNIHAISNLQQHLHISCNHPKFESNFSCHHKHLNLATYMPFLIFSNIYIFHVIILNLIPISHVITNT